MDDREAHSVLTEILGVPLADRGVVEARPVVLDDHVQLPVEAQREVDRDLAFAVLVGVPARVRRGLGDREP